METFIGMHSSRAKNRREKPDPWLLCENKTVVFLFAQHSYAEHRFDNQGCELVAQQAKTHKVMKSKLWVCFISFFRWPPLSLSIFSAALASNTYVGWMNNMNNAVKMINVNKQTKITTLKWDFVECLLM